MTDAERVLWLALRDGRLAGHKFRRQVPLGPYILDFVSFAGKLIIEVDGGQHAERTAYDARRSAFLEREGFRVIRFWNTEVLTSLEGALTAILSALQSPPESTARAPSAPSPLAGEGRGEGGASGAGLAGAAGPASP